MKVHQGLEKIFHIYKWYDESKASMAKIALNKYLQENKTFKFWTFLSFSVLLLLFTHSVTSKSLKPHGLQHVRLSCPSLSLGVWSNSCPLIQWCHPTISSSVALFSFCLQSFPASGTFPMSQLFISGGQCIGALASASVLPMNIQGWFPLGWTIYHINLSDLKYHISHLKWCFLWKPSFNLGMTSF